MNKSKLVGYGILSALAVSAYVAMVVLIMNNAQRFIGVANGYLGGLAILMLFVVSAAIVGLLVFGRPIYLYFENHKKEALIQMFSTIVGLIVILLVILSTLVVLK